MKDVVVRSNLTVRMLVLGLFAVAAISLFGVYRARSGPQLYRQSQFLMDTFVEMTVASQNEQKANEAMAAAFAEMRRIEALLSRYLPESDVSRINAEAGEGRVTQVSRETHDMVQRALQYAVLTDGLFDLTVGPIVDLWGIGTQHEHVPGEAELRQVLPYVGYKQVEMLENGGIRVQYPEVKLDLGGIAKGYGVDQAAEVLRRFKIASALVNAGGNVRCLGTKPDGTPWRIGIQHPRKPEEILGIIPLHDLAVATSGDYERFFMRDDIRYHHIFVPQTGQPARECQSVTIIAKTAEMADAFSTTVFVMGPERGLKFIEGRKDVEGLIIDAQGKISSSAGFSLTAGH